MHCHRARSVDGHDLAHVAVRILRLRIGEQHLLASLPQRADPKAECLGNLFPAADHLAIRGNCVGTSGARTRLRQTSHAASRRPLECVGVTAILEQQADDRGAVAVHVEDAGLEDVAAGVALVRNRLPASFARPHGGGQAVRCVVRAIDDFIQILESQHAHHGPKDLVRGDGHLIFHACEQCRLDVITAVAPAFAAGDELGPFLLADVDVFENFVELGLVHLRALLRFGIERVA